jgi:predicted RNase H-like HicB family nuclease
MPAFANHRQWWEMPAKRPKAMTTRLKVEFDREVDGRWIADIPALPGVMVYGRTRRQALTAVEALALRVIADRLEHGEAVPKSFTWI